MRSLFILSFLFLLAPSEIWSQINVPNERPKLVVGIVVDQMRYDYIQKYWDKFGEGGFKKLVKEGFQCTNAYFDYIPTYTGPGHATIYAGSPPSNHGICANIWLGEDNQTIYCVEDESIEDVSEDIVGGISPLNFLGKNFADLLNSDSTIESKVISISLKDRAAVLPGGHLSNGTYWYNSKTGNWITSSFYAKELPFWVKDFNDQGFPDKHFEKGWNTIAPIEIYIESGPDSSIYESPFMKGGKITFPYELNTMKEELGYGLIKSTPHGNTLTRDFAVAAMEGEQLGRNGGTDALLISFSSTDYIGHQFGPQSVEVEDAYIRLDIDLAQMIAYMQGVLGKENVLFMLTSDHGVVDVPQFLIDQNKPGGYYSESELKKHLNSLLESKYGLKDAIRGIINQNIYFEQSLLSEDNEKYNLYLNEVESYLREQSYVQDVLMPESKKSTESKGKLVEMAMNGYFPGRSGQVIFISKAGWTGSKSAKGTTHGSGYDYDTHVPLLFCGWKVKAQTFEKEVRIEQIAPTLLKALEIETSSFQFPPLPIN